MLSKLNNLKEENIVKILTDRSCRMKAVLVNDEKVMEGNYEDFYNGCHGDYDIPDYNSALELAHILIRIIEKKGQKAELVNEAYRYE